MSRSACIMRRVVVNLSFDIPEHHSILKDEFLVYFIKKVITSPSICWKDEAMGVFKITKSPGIA